MSKAIEVEDLVVRYRGKGGRAVQAVDGLSFSVERGEVVGFLGPNGAGKSSTLKALMGFVSPAAGSAFLFEHAAGTSEAKARAGYLPEVALYYPFLNPLETLTLYGELQGLRGKELREEATSLLETVGLSSAMRKQNRSLSKGMLQRVGIAQALLGSPELLILDEVTSGLDPIGRQELRAILLERLERGATLFFSSHELAEVEMLCDRILVIDKGRLIEERKIGELKDKLRQYVMVVQSTKPLVARTSSDQASESSGGNLASALEVLGEGIWRAKFETKEALLEALHQTLSSGLKVVDIVAQEGSLEDYFIETVRRAA